MDEFTGEMEFSRRILLRLAALGHDWSNAIRETPEGDLIVDNLSVVVLCRLAAEDRLRPVQLQESLQMTSGGISKLIDRLEETGFVARLGTKPAEDRRGVEVALTKKGRAALGNVLGAIAPSVEQAVIDLQGIAAEFDVGVEAGTMTEP